MGVHCLINSTISATDGSSSSLSSSMRNTFRSISSSVTAMRGGGGTSSRLSERRGVVLQQNSAMITYDATRMVLDDTNDKFVVPPNETSNGRRVKVSLNPFAQGGLRNVYRMTMKDDGGRFGTTSFVAKESRHDVGYRERLRFHIETSKCHIRADEYAKKFNKRKNKKMKMRNNSNKNKNAKNIIIPPIRMLKTEVIRLKDERTKGGYRYLAVEPELKEGTTYTKYNNNTGYVNPSTSCLPCEVAQAFSHFSYEHSDQTEIVVDVQGCEYTYTDPQLHSSTKEFGRADRGESGIKDFFKTHKCNFLCNALLLKDRSNEFRGNSSPPLPPRTKKNTPAVVVKMECK